MKTLISALVLVTSSIVAGQRGSFAGTRPIGFPDTPNRTTTTPDPLGNRFGEGASLPIEANGDWDLVDRLSKLPIDKQPFWFINWQSYETQRKNPQTYPQRPNAFVDPIPLNTNSGQVNNGFSTPVPGFIGTEPTVILNRFGSTTTPSQPSNTVSSNSNLNNNAYPIPNIYPGSNVYPNVNANSNSNVYPSGNNNPTSVYPNVNANSNSNVYPSGNNNPTSNVNSPGKLTPNVYPTDKPTSNVYPTGKPITNVYPTINPNSNIYQTTNFNSHSNSDAVAKNGASFQTTHKYQWESQYFASSNTGTTNLKKYPEYYQRTDTYPQRRGHEFF